MRWKGNCVSRHITQGLAWGYDHRQATRLVDCRKTARSIVKRTRQHDADDAHASKRGQRVEKQIDSPVAVRLIGIRCHGAHGPGDQGQVVRRFADVDASRPKPLILIGNNHRHAAGSLQDLPKLADGGPSPVQDDHHHGIKTGPFVQKITQILKPFATRGANGNCPREMCLHPSTLCDTCPHSEREEKHLVCRRQLRPHSNNLRQICSSRCPEGIALRRPAWPGELVSRSLSLLEESETSRVSLGWSGMFRSEGASSVTERPLASEAGTVTRRAHRLFDTPYAIPPETVVRMVNRTVDEGRRTGTDCKNPASFIHFHIHVADAAKRIPEVADAAQLLTQRLKRSNASSSTGTSAPHADADCLPR